MGYKKLISPEFRVTVGDYEVTDGIEVECFSSKESHMDWCRVELSPQLQGVLKFKDMDEASVELGYEDDFDSLIDGYVRCGDTDYWKEIMIKDDMMKLDRVTIKACLMKMVSLYQTGTGTQPLYRMMNVGFRILRMRQ